MKLRLLELTNVRRFASQTARLGPFGDGLTTITAENEAGKSTFFDALHALFFFAHGSKDQKVRALQPYSGGAVEIAAEVEVDGTSYRIEKRFLSAPAAKVIETVTGQVLKQQGDAEQWIEDHINRAFKGPAGLLWVRQGDAHVDPAGRGKDADNIAARRNLMSSVRGQIDAVTGGRRMDQIMEQCRREFEALSTQGIKAKATGPWKAVEDQIAKLSLEQERLTAKVAELGQALRTKARIAARLRQLEDRAAQAERAAQIAVATETLEQAKAHAQNVTKADQAVQLVEAEAARLAREIADIESAQKRRQQMAEQITKTRQELEQAVKNRGAAEAALKEGTAQTQALDAREHALRAEVAKAHAGAKQREEWVRLHRVTGLLAELEGPKQQLTAAREVLDGPMVAQSDIERLTDLSQRISIAQERRRAHFARLTLHPVANQNADLDGAPVPPEAPLLIDRAMRLSIEGYGAIALEPAQAGGVDIEDPRSLEETLSTTLKTLGVPSLKAARDVLAARQKAEGDTQVAQANLRVLAPDGPAALLAEQQHLCAALNHTIGTPLPAVEVQTHDPLAEIDAKRAEIDTARAALAPQVEAQRETVMSASTAEATASGVLNHQLAEQGANTEPEDEAETLSALQTKHADTLQKTATAKEALSQLTVNGPDLATAQATYDRLQNAAAADLEEIAMQRRELARTDGAIEAQSEGAVEENLAAVTGSLNTARARSARYEKQARALRLLMEHLDAARKDAQETYFEPIRTELRPLLAQLHAGAVFELDPDRMLVDTITRNGVEDKIDVLSGGAYEQIAILTRLAFARLFAKQGCHVPVILDDALVHTDDERISTMFTMLSQAAKDQQIIVLSCRTRAFSDLGGTRAAIEVSAS